MKNSVKHTQFLTSNYDTTYDIFIIRTSSPFHLPYETEFKKFEVK